MGRLPAGIKNHIRTVVQILFTALTNGYARGFAEGSIFRGPSKAVCLPGLNCYSCPGALGSCPIGSLQATLDSGQYRIAFYVSGFLLFFGALFGRFICGWLCPFGLVQDLLYRIPFIRKMKRLPGDRWLRFLKYVILVLFVILLPMTVLDAVGHGDPWFCKYICPSGTLFAGIPLIASNPALQASLGFLFTWKTAILVILVLLSIIVYRPFCRYLCPLGAVYGFFNPIALYRFRIDRDKCTECGLCRKACRMDISVFEKPNSPECIRCGDCLKACPHHAIEAGVLTKHAPSDKINCRRSKKT